MVLPGASRGLLGAALGGGSRRRRRRGPAGLRGHARGIRRRRATPPRAPPRTRPPTRRTRSPHRVARDVSLRRVGIGAWIGRARIRPGVWQRTRCHARASCRSPRPVVRPASSVRISSSSRHRVIRSSGHPVIASSGSSRRRVIAASHSHLACSHLRVSQSHSLTVSQSHSLTAWGPQRTGARGDASRPWRRARRRGSAAAGLAVRRPRTREVGESRIARGEISCTARAFVARLSRSRRKVTCPKRRASGAGSRFVAAWAGATRALISIYSAVIFIVRARRVGSPGDVK